MCKRKSQKRGKQSLNRYKKEGPFRTMKCYYLNINFITRINIGAITTLIEEMVLISVVFILDLYTKIKLHNLSIRVFRLKNKKERAINATGNEINIEKSDKIIGYLKICIKPSLISK